MELVRTESPLTKDQSASPARQRVPRDAACAHEARGDFRGCRDMGAYYDDYDPDRAYLGAIAEPGAWYDNYVNDYADEEDDHEDDYDFGGA